MIFAADVGDNRFQHHCSRDQVRRAYEAAPFRVMKYEARRGRLERRGKGHVRRSSGVELVKHPIDVPRVSVCLPQLNRG